MLTPIECPAPRQIHVPGALVRSPDLPQRVPDDLAEREPREQAAFLLGWAVGIIETLGSVTAQLHSLIDWAEDIANDD